MAMNDFQTMRLMFKTLVLRELHQLSDDRMEYRILDRLSFQQFLGLNLFDDVPDAKSMWQICRLKTRSRSSKEIVVNSSFKMHHGSNAETASYLWREEFGYDGTGGRRRYFYNSLNRLERAEVNEGMAKILNYEYYGLGRRIGMSNTLSGNTRRDYLGLGLNLIEEVFKRGFRLADDPRDSRNEKRAAP